MDETRSERWGAASGFAAFVVGAVGGALERGWPSASDPAAVAAFIAANRTAILAQSMAFVLSAGFYLWFFATWLVAPGFRGSRRADTIRHLLVGNGLLSIIGAVCTAVFDRWVFSTAGLFSFAAWNLLIASCYALIAISPSGGFAHPVRSPDNDA